MSQAIPAVVSFLECSNKDLVRSVASYLSLATIDNAHLLAQHMTLVLDTVLKGEEYDWLVTVWNWKDKVHPLLLHVIGILFLFEGLKIWRFIHCPQ